MPKNQLNLYPVFRRLAMAEKAELACPGGFLPREHGLPSHLTAEDGWR